MLRISVAALAVVGLARCAEPPRMCFPATLQPTNGTSGHRRRPAPHASSFSRALYMVTVLHEVRKVLHLKGRRHGAAWAPSLAENAAGRRGCCWALMAADGRMVADGRWWPLMAADGC